MSGRTAASLLALAALAALATSACGGPAAPAAAAPARPTASAPAPPPSPVAATSVDIANFAFSPAVITVRAGATVTWTNRDEDAHTVAITGTPVSPPLQSGDAFTHRFDRPGTYSYVCSIHPSMRGMVVVTAG